MGGVGFIFFYSSVQWCAVSARRIDKRNFCHAGTLERGKKQNSKFIKITLFKKAKRKKFLKSERDCDICAKLLSAKIIIYFYRSKKFICKRLTNSQVNLKTKFLG